MNYKKNYELARSLRERSDKLFVEVIRAGVAQRGSRRALSLELKMSENYIGMTLSNHERRQPSAIEALAEKISKAPIEG